MKNNGSPAASAVGPGVAVDLEAGARVHGVGDEHLDAGHPRPEPRNEMPRPSWCLRAIASLLFLSQLGLGATARADTAENTGYETLAIPLPFYNESFGFAAGYVYGRAGWPEPQARVLGTAMAGSRGSAMLLLAGQDLRTPWLDRLFIDPFASVGYFGEIESYINGNPDFAGQSAGRNDSATVGARSCRATRWSTVSRFGGFTGAQSLNPLESGRTFTDFRPFYRSQEIDGDDLSTTISTNGVDLGLTWDNRDFQTNPARGQSVTLALSRDFGAFNSSDSWTVLQAEVDQ